MLNHEPGQIVSIQQVRAKCSIDHPVCIFDHRLDRLPEQFPQADRVVHVFTPMPGCIAREFASG